jgi:hypothetical protein
VTPGHGSIEPGFGRNYLEKLVQIILPVPRLSRDVVLDCVRSFGFAEEATEIVRWAPGREILNPRRLKRYLNTLSVTLQLVMASRLPERFDNTFALRAISLRADWPNVYDCVLNSRDAYSMATWPEKPTDHKTSAEFREYLAKLRITEGDLNKFEQFLVTSNLFPARALNVTDRVAGEDVLEPTVDVEASSPKIGDHRTRRLGRLKREDVMSLYPKEFLKNVEISR